MQNPEVAVQHQFSEQEILVLQDVLQVLESPHRVQELLSGEKTPTLSCTLPAFEEVIDYWKTLRITIPELDHYINIGIRKLEEYVGEARKTRVYAHAMGAFFILYFIN